MSANPNPTVTTVASGLLPPSEFDQMDPYLAMVTQDMNGTNIYSNSRAQAGFLEATKYMLVPKDFYDDALQSPTPDSDIIDIGKSGGISGFLGAAGQPYRANNSYLVGYTSVATDAARKFMMLKIISLNYASLTNAGVSETDAAYAAMFRARWCITGGLAVALKDTFTPHMEIRSISSTDQTYGPIVSAADKNELAIALGAKAKALANHITDQNFGVAWVVFYAENVWGAVEHAFRVRGHHFKSTGADKQSYTELYQRYLTACYEGDYRWPPALDPASIFHMAIHPFKIRALPIMVAHFAAYGKLAEAALIRLEGAPNGTAVITTTFAALDTMKSEPWYDAFATVFQADLEDLEEAHDAIMDQKYSAHNGASLYGVNKVQSVTIRGRSQPLAKLRSRFSALASAAQGMINGLNHMKANNMVKSYALANAKALEKAAASNPMLAVRITLLVTKTFEELSSIKDLATAIKVALPNLTNASGNP